jgi:two-component sensor histidine kinase
VLNELERAVSPNVIHFEAPQGISILADRAILIGLIINELVSNAGKYAYPDRPGGPIWVTVAQIEKRAITLSIRDEGVGLPADFDLAKSKRLGTRLVSALSEQLGAELTQPASATGSNFALLVPLQAI